jgi:GMP synthase (glutamine-hydrolysing)
MSLAKCYRFFPEDEIKKDPLKFVEEARKFIRENLKPEDKVLTLVSGGVDSSVNTALFDLEIGDRLYAIHIDTGFMRLINGEEESKIVEKKFSSLRNFQMISAREEFYEKVFGIEDAEQKRKGFQEAYRIVTDKLVSSFDCNAMTHGTIFPDIKETPVIKTQHNVDVPFKKVKKVIEPLAGLYKNDVRRLAKFLFEEYGFEFLRDVDKRQPFPGPGLAVRTVGKINIEKLNVEKKANDIVERGIEEYTKKLYGTTMFIDPETEEQIPFQYFSATFDNKFEEVPENISERIELAWRKVKARVLCSRATGIINEKRVYSNVICVEDKINDFEDLRRWGGKVLPYVTGYSRTLYRIAEGNEKSPYVVSVRAVRSKDAVYAEIFDIPFDILTRIGKEIVKKCDVASVYFDISSKPPATIEYE